MKSFLVNVAGMTLIFLLNFSIVSAQDRPVTEGEMMELKMDLVNAKMELLKSNLNSLEERPLLLESRLDELEEDIEALSFKPGLFNQKLNLLDSLISLQEYLLQEQRELNDRMLRKENRVAVNSQGISANEDYIPPQQKYTIAVNPVRLFEGTMEVSMERVVSRKNTLELSALATYASRQGLARYYVTNQSLSYFDAARSEYISYDSENITGFGGSLAWKNYLIARTNPGFSAPGGPYVAPMTMYRRLTLSGFENVYNEETEVYDQVEVIQKLNVYSGGFLAGWQFVLWNVVTADLYVGGIIRLSNYDGEEGFTKYKQLQNVDYSGVLPTIGLKIGVVK